MPNTRREEAVQGFFEAFNRGDLDAVIALYEPKATMVAQPGQMAEGRAAIREALIQVSHHETDLDHGEEVAGHGG